MSSTTSSPWDPEQYERFAAERSRPFHDLVALVEPRPGMRVLDLGCGTGKLTRHLHEHLGARETLGVDSSETMLAESAQHACEGLSFRPGRIEDVEEDGWDLVFSNAALHWIDRHEELLAKLAGLLAPGGQLAIQIPANHDHVSHTVAAGLAREEPFRTALDGFVLRSPVLYPEAYALLFDRLALKDVRVRLEVYSHHLGSRVDVVEWVKGAALTSYERRMPANRWHTFLDEYRARLLPQLEDAAPYLFPFKRILMRASAEED